MTAATAFTDPGLAQVIAGARDANEHLTRAAREITAEIQALEMKLVQLNKVAAASGFALEMLETERRRREQAKAAEGAS